MKSVIFIALVCCAITGCNLFDRINNIDTTKITASPSAVEANLQIGPDHNTFATAVIKSVKFECVPIEIKNDKNTSSRYYEIILTAAVAYHINNSILAPYMSKVVFDAKSKQGVVIGTTEALVKLTSSSEPNGIDVSAKIVGLTHEEISRVSYIIARWSYDK